MKVEILCTGDEILTGKTINTNHSFIAQRLVEKGFEVWWGTTVGDDRASLAAAFAEAGARAGVVIVNGGLGPTVDDLSQEVAASAAGVSLTLHESWLARMDAWYTSRGRVMPDNNRKQAMLPEGAEFIDNPIGTACGFAITIGHARFYFTPGVPREMRRMISEQVIPRMEGLRGSSQTMLVKRFHSFGIGESRADQMLNDIEKLGNGAVKLGFQSHYPQLETKLTATGADAESLEAVIAPLATEVRKRLGNFVLCEDDQSLEGTIAEALGRIDGSISVIEMDTAGGVTSRLMNSSVDFRRGTVCASLGELGNLFPDQSLDGALSTDLAAGLATLLQQRSGASHALVVLTTDPAPPAGATTTTEWHADIYIAIAGPAGNVVRQARLPGGAEWIRIGATELGLDCLRRFLLNLPVSEKIDFEQH